ncbi:MAG: phage tail tape measure protein, partial [Acinetobacter sp.]
MYQMRKPIDETKHVEVEENRIASLGLGKESTKEAIQYAKAMKTFGTSTLDNLQLVRDGVTAFADVHHAKMVAPTLAKMKFSNKAMYGDDGAENEKKFMDMLKVIEMRNGLKSEKAFHEQANIIQQVITATGGRVQAEEWLNVIKTGGIAAKGIDNKAFYYKLEPLVQEMGGFRVGTAMMSAYQNVYQGRTTKRAANNLERLGLISDPTKVQHDKSGQISFLDVGAIKGAELFKKDQFAWMEQVLVPQLKSKGITKEGDIIDAMGSIFTNRTASNLFAQMYMQRDQIHKNAKLNSGADDIDQLNSKAMKTTTGKEIEAKANLHDAYLKFGTTILPIYTSAIETATVALQGFNGWMERNPTLAKMLGVGLLGIAASLIVIGGALAVFSPLILGMLSLRLMMATFTGSTAVFSRAFSVLPTIFNIAKVAFMGLGNVFMW